VARVKKNDAKNDNPGHKIYFGSGARVFFFTHGLPEQVAPFIILKKCVDYFRLSHVFLTLINQNSQFQFSKTSAAHSGVWNAND
jgi:hypothetical protein